MVQPNLSPTAEALETNLWYGRPSRRPAHEARRRRSAETLSSLTVTGAASATRCSSKPLEPSLFSGLDSSVDAPTTFLFL